jgi:hypothetical protein
MKEEEFFQVVFDREKENEEVDYHKDCLLWLSSSSEYYEVYDVEFYNVTFKKRGSYSKFRKNLLEAVTEFGFDPSRVSTIHSKDGSSSPHGNQDRKTKLFSLESNSFTQTPIPKF